jgi:Patatin-like phospholipase
MMQGNDDGPYSLSEVLLEELEAIKGSPVLAGDGHGVEIPLCDVFAGLPIRGHDESLNKRNERLRLRWVCDATHQLGLYDATREWGLAALCLSGGGIRSASLSLGLVQGLADKNLLRRFNYLSTVSGGGYIGSWLSAWLHHVGNADQVLEQLRSRRTHPDAEPAAIRHLRDYSSFLTPKVGLFSADTWTAVAIILRNILLNWLILVPAIGLPVVGIKLFAALLHQRLSASTEWFIALACLALSALAVGYKLFRLYSAELMTNARRAQKKFLQWSLTPVIAAGACFSWLVNQERTPADAIAYTVLPSTWPALQWWPMVVFALIVYGGAIAGAFVKASPKALGRTVLSGNRPFAFRPKDFGAWAAAVIVFATLVWFGAQSYARHHSEITLIGELCVKDPVACVPDAKRHAQPVRVNKEILLAVFGMPWFLLATLLAQTTYLLLRSYSREGEVEREWLGRASGWHFIAALAWVVLSGLVLLGPKLYYGADTIISNGGNWITGIGGLSGVVTALLGKSSLTPAQGAASDWKGISSNLVLAIAGPLFAAILLILLSVVFDWAVLGDGVAMYKACFSSDRDHALAACGTRYWIVLGLALFGVLLVADFFANVNRFSLHTLYRNRLIRAFLGGARAPRRQPDGFTGFDWEDNLRVGSLWGASAPTGANWRPYQVINMTLNLASTKRLAWQQRKAECFIVTPKFCGSADLGYRRTEAYGDPQGGISLGTAMAISGAAVSPNMGYHSSPSIAFLLTLFNVRLGWWLGNSGAAGGRLPKCQDELKRLLNFGRPGNRAPYAQEAPWLAIGPLLAELFGLTTDDSSYVYLSDGGHFEDLALYEMVRRRCRWIIVCDGGQDLGREFEDLGNAVRKIWIDLGVRIRFPNSPLLAATKDTKSEEMPYFALGTIEYLSDGNPTDPPTGKLLYIRPLVRGDEGAADFISYQRLHPDFPNQSTFNQWFDEPQLEAYRALGYHMIAALIDATGDPLPLTLSELFDRLAQLDPISLEQQLREIPPAEI